jgi:hypothetical protein
VFEEVWFEHEAESVRSVTPRIHWPALEHEAESVRSVTPRIHWPALRIRLESLPRLRM